MGLSIYAAKKIFSKEHLEFIEALNRSNKISFGEELKVDDFLEMNNKNISPSSDDLPFGVNYSLGEIFSLNIGSYSSYGELRRAISNCILGLSPEEIWEMDRYEHPLDYLVNNSDCEAIFGPWCCETIHSSMVANREKFMNHVGWDSILLTRYDRLLDGFAYAAQGGALVFC